MLKKLVAIKNVGRFLKAGARGDADLKRYNLIFAENGRGKTTLCAILRSLQTGEPDHVIGRTTLGVTGAPEINIRADVGNYTFGAGAWNAKLPDLAVFDSTFISDNVYSGDHVHLDHRRNLYRVIIGTAGVNLAKAVDDLDDEIRAKTSEIRDHRATVLLHAPSTLTVEAFLPLVSDPEIDEKIAAQRKTLDAVGRAEEIEARGVLSPVKLPRLPEGLAVLLDLTVEGMAKDAGDRVAAHMAAHGMAAHGEAWLAEGRGYIRDDACPFCDQPLAGVTLINAYATYFSVAYHDLKQRIAAQRIAVESAMGDRAIADAEKPIAMNDAASEFWLRYVDIERPVLPHLINDPLCALRDAALGLLDKKVAAPLERITVDPGYTAAIASVAALQAEVDAYNAAVVAANDLITVKKANTSKSEMRMVEAALLQLQAGKARHEPEATAACSAYVTAVEEKTDLERRKAASKMALDTHTGEVIGRYEKSINVLLDDFQAGFRITGTKHYYPGGAPASSFQIVINDTPVDLGDEKTTPATPSFRNTLSSGDKSTLALAFFLAQLEHDPGRANKIVVFDDPFNSHDAFRKDHTVAQIKKCGEACQQVIVLSHDPGFLKRVWDRLEAGDRKTLQLARLGLRETVISEWDIEKATQERYRTDIRALADYYNAGEGDPRDVINKIRPVLESHARLLYPKQFGDREMLGGMIATIRKDAAHPLATIVDDMENLNEYTKRYHHGENPQAALEQINDGELQGFVKKTLAITGYC